MKTEMDVMRMDERQRQAWIRANRVTLMAVGMTWLGIIGWELTHQRTPVFMIVMVPVFALVRFGFYRYYSRVNSRT